LPKPILRDIVIFLEASQMPRQPMPEGRYTARGQAKLAAATIAAGRDTDVTPP